MIWINKFKKMDIWTLVVMLCLIAIGTLAVYEATIGTKLDGLHIKNIKLFAVFIVPMLLAALFDYRLIAGKLSYVLYGIGIGMLILVHFMGENANGAVRWLDIGAFQLQPSELMKLFTVLLAAHLLHQRNGQKLRLVQDILPICLVFIIPIAFILKQPDLGTSLVFVGVLLGMLWMGNIRVIYMALCVGIGAAAIGAVFWLYHTNYDMLANVVESHQMDRIQTFIDPSSDPDKAWHVKNAMIAIGSGGLNGDDVSFFQKGFIPYVYSDSIFVVIGEKFGFVGAAILLLLYFFLIYRMALIMRESRELAGAYLMTGLMGMFIFQIFVNIGMHLGLMPLTGISLPFISYGGSTMLTNMIAIGLVLSIQIHKNEPVIEI